MKKIVGFQNKGGMRLRDKWNFSDKELLKILGAKGMKRFFKELLVDIQKAQRGTLECSPVEDFFKEMDTIINMAKVKKYDV